MDRRIATRLLPVVATFGLAGCGALGPHEPVDGQSPVGSPPPLALEPSQVRIENDPTALESRVTRSARRLTVSPRRQDGAAVSEKTHSDRAMGVRLTLVAEIAPPVVDGRVVQANDIEIQGGKAIVAYNFAGEIFAGAVQFIDVSRPARPELESEVMYASADVNAVAMQGSDVYVGLAADDPTLSTPAVVHELELRSRGLARTDAWRQLPSWAVTDLVVQGDDVVATVGARDGGLVSIRRHDFALVGFAPVDDARGVSLTSRGVMAVVGGPGRMLEFRGRELVPAGVTEIPGFAQEGAKGTIEWSSNRCYLGSGDGGLQVRDDTGAMLAQLANVEFSDRAPCVVNAFTVANHLGFVAAGPAGVQVVRLGRYRCDGRESEETESLRVLGEIDLEEGASCNMVRARNDVLVVAGGTGGVKFIQMEFLD